MGLGMGFRVAGIGRDPPGLAENLRLRLPPVGRDVEERAELVLQGRQLRAMPS